MRRVTRVNAPYVCPSCLIAASRGIATSRATRTSLPIDNTSKLSVRSASSSRATYSTSSGRQSAPPNSQLFDRVRFVTSKEHKGVRNVTTTASVADAEAGSDPIVLTEQQMQQLQAAYRLRKRLAYGANSSALNKGTGKPIEGIPLTEVLKRVHIEDSPPDEARILGTIRQAYADRTYGVFADELAVVTKHRASSGRVVKDERTKQILNRLGMLGQQSGNPDPASAESSPSEASSESPAKPAPRGTRQQRQSLLNVFSRASDKSQSGSRSGSAKPAPKVEAPPPFPEKTRPVKIRAKDLHLNPVEAGPSPPVPQLSFDLSRVLFNPGVYHLQDPRSRVYNFDPYLEQPMPISEFNFDALNAYVTSSEDQDLLGLARRLDKRYIGSSSSMSAALCQFHYLLSNWRELNTSQMTRGFAEVRQDYTVIMRSPAAIFLRYRNGVYAVDADKEYDTPNVLMSLGKSLEKLLTLEKDDIEKWRRKHTSEDESFSDVQDEAFHYSEQGPFLLRSQLDAYDPRLPGTGVFDLKTRAVAGIRMNMRAHEEGMGYQIKDRFGTWESYEREYYDMMRSTMLKYSMQVRMGKMDGIFVAYHNIGRIFGFQYVPLSDMDHAIHGQSDPCLGDQEFKLSIDLMKTIFDKATAKYPEQSIRFHFDTREASTADPKPYMQIFAEPMTNEEIDDVQKRHNEEFEAFEKRIFSGQDADAEASADTAGAVDVKDETSSVDLTKGQIDAITSQKNESTSSTAADTGFLDMIMKAIPADAQPKPIKPVLGFKLSVQNYVNDFPVIRPDDLTLNSSWNVNYVLDQMSDESARKHYIFCKNRRMAALSVSKRQSGSYIKSIQALSERGAEWRRKQDELDAQRETVVLYQDRIKT